MKKITRLKTALIICSHSLIGVAFSAWVNITQNGNLLDSTNSSANVGGVNQLNKYFDVVETKIFETPSTHDGFINNGVFSLDEAKIETTIKYNALNVKKDYGDRLKTATLRLNTKQYYLDSVTTNPDNLFKTKDSKNFYYLKNVETYLSTTNSFDENSSTLAFNTSITPLKNVNNDSSSITLTNLQSDVISQGDVYYIKLVQSFKIPFKFEAGLNTLVKEADKMKFDFELILEGVN